MKLPAGYEQVVAKAEKAVEGVKDPELRRIAFQRVLDDMLAARETPSPTKARAKASKGGSTGTVDTKKSGKSGPQAYVQELVTDGFFKKPKTLAQVKVELVNRGHHIPATSLSGPLQLMCQRKALRRERAKDGDKKQSFVYSEW